jgi:hypothetical protein
MANYRIIMPTVESDITINYPTTGGTLALEGGGGGGASGGFTFYDVTLRDCENTSSSVKIIETTIPANTWEDGQALTLDIAYDILNQSGSSDMPMLDVRVGIFAVMSLMGSIANGIGTRQWIRTTFFRNGNNLYISGNTSFKDNGFAYPVDVSALTNPPTVLGTSAIPDASTSFASNLTIALDFRFMNANPSLYVRPFYGTAYKTEKGSVL